MEYTPGASRNTDSLTGAGGLRPSRYTPGLQALGSTYEYGVERLSYYDGEEGDCYAYACTAKALLTRAGIPNLDIRRIPTSFEHYWNLVDVGEGWYHFDTTPRPDHPTIFLWTDAELMEYNAEHYGAFDYDPALYPEIN